jgi:hypothetical protein
MRVRKISLALIAMLGGLAAAPPQAKASFLIGIDQSGSNVVGTGSGSINTGALSIEASPSKNALINATDGEACRPQLCYVRKFLGCRIGAF